MPECQTRALDFFAQLVLNSTGNAVNQCSVAPTLWWIMLATYLAASVQTTESDVALLVPRVSHTVVDPCSVATEGGQLSIMVVLNRRAKLRCSS